MNYGFFTAQEFLPAGLGFGLYSKAHLTWLAVLSILAAAMCVAYKKLSPKGRRRMRRALALYFLLGETVRDLILAAQGVFGAFYWPLHMCGLAMFIFLGYAVHPNRFCGETLYSLCLPGTLAALIFPDWAANQPVFHFQSVHSFVYHGLLAGGILMLLVSREFRPRADGLKYPLLMLVLIVPPLYFLNKVVNANYLFLNTPARGSPLEALGNAFGNPGYLLPFGVLAFCVISVFYLPLWVKKAIANFKKTDKTSF